jgi:hypothetical protein
MQSACGRGGESSHDPIVRDACQRGSHLFHHPSQPHQSFEKARNTHGFGVRLVRSLQPSYNPTVEARRGSTVVIETDLLESLPTMDAELKREARSVIDRIVNLRDSL